MLCRQQMLGLFMPGCFPLCFHARFKFSRGCGFSRAADFNRVAIRRLWLSPKRFRLNLDRRSVMRKRCNAGYRCTHDLGYLLERYIGIRPLNFSASSEPFASLLLLFYSSTGGLPYAHQCSPLETLCAPQRPDRSHRSATLRISYPRSSGWPGSRSRQISFHRSHHAYLDGRYSSVHAAGCPR